MKPLGEIKRLNPRQVWKNEAADFTPWLRDNVALLASTLGLELDLVESEAPIGDFKGDLVAKDLNSGRSVIIENQLDPTDHKHLGQLLTYAANKKAGVIVWISPEFRDEHRQALEWLNDVTAEDVDFFGLQLELLQIDASDPAPNFSIVAKPSAWLKESRKKAQVTPRQQAYHDFFTALLKELKAKLITSADSVGYGSGIGLSAGRTGFTYYLGFVKDKRFGVDLYIDTGDYELNKLAFDLLEQELPKIQEEVGPPIKWQRLDDKRACRISVYREGSITDPPEVLDDLKKWAVEKVVQVRKAFTPRLKQLKLEAS